MSVVDPIMDWHDMAGVRTYSPDINHLMLQAPSPITNSYMYTYYIAR